MVRYEWAKVPREWTREGLRSCGFEGFVPLLTVKRADIPPDVGNYVVLRTSDGAPTFLERRPALTDRQPHTHYPVRVLESAWTPGCPVLYVGKADPQTLRARVWQYARYGRGVGSNHQGGRRLWQLLDADDALVAWRVLPEAARQAGRTGKQVEDAFLTEFRETYGHLPWANVAAPSVLD